MPSAKYSLSFSALMFANGRTATALRDTATVGGVLAAGTADGTAADNPREAFPRDNNHPATATTSTAATTMPIAPRTQFLGSLAAAGFDVASTGARFDVGGAIGPGSLVVRSTSPPASPPMARRSRQFSSIFTTVSASAKRSAGSFTSSRASIACKSCGR